jgi:hypothetical protein
VRTLVRSTGGDCAVSQLTIRTPARSTLVMWAAGICAVLAMALALTTHRGNSAPSPKQDEPVGHGWVRGLFANNETHKRPR